MFPRADRQSVLAFFDAFASKKKTMQLLRAQADNGCAVVLVTHIIRYAAWADRILCLRDGRLIDEVHPPAGPESLLSRERV
ncbi:MAG TPA: hypothetical protein VG253_02785 [Streptosporangiaceae bacterium]|nr:hypothetical protein [Streptosporangiaceae bacterium]